MPSRVFSISHFCNELAKSAPSRGPLRSRWRQFGQCHTSLLLSLFLATGGRDQWRSLSVVRLAVVGPRDMLIGPPSLQPSFASASQRHVHQHLNVDSCSQEPVFGSESSGKGTKPALLPEPLPQQIKI